MRLLILAALLAGCRGPEARSLLGRPLYPPEIPADTRADFERKLADARAEWEKDPDDPERILWLGRRTAYLGRYREAIAIFTTGLEKHPENAKLLRHRGHRFITVREFDRAIADLERAAALIRGVPDEIEPDGLPNKANRPRGTTHSNIWYHLALAHYLRADFEDSLRCWRECLAVSTNDDMLCAVSHWLYMTLRRLGREEEAARVLDRISDTMEILENTAYHALLLMYQGGRSPDALSDPDQATCGYGIGNWHLYNGRPEEARKSFEEVIRGPSWAAFGFIAAEAELANGRRSP